MILLCKDDVGSIVKPTSSLVWADVILADFQRVISHYLPDISTYLSCTAQRVWRTIFMQNSKPNYACLPSKIVEVWIDRFCVRYDWWRRVQPTSSVSPVWFCSCPSTTFHTFIQSNPLAVVTNSEPTGSMFCARLWPFNCTTYVGFTILNVSTNNDRPRPETNIQYIWSYFHISQGPFY